MARELISYQIVVDERPAQQALSRVEASQQRVESGAQKMGREVDTALAKAREQAAKVTEAYNRGEASTKAWTAAQRELTRAQADVISHTEKTTEAVKTTDAATKDATKSAGAMTNVVQGLGRALVAAFAVERIVSFGHEAIRTGSHIKDLADRTGLSIRAVQELGYAADQSGSSIETVADAISTMSRNLVAEQKAAVGAVEGMGLSVRALRAMRPEQAFLDIADAIGKLQNPMERAAAAQQVFGQRGKELLPGMVEGWRAQAEEAGKVGAVIEEDNVKALASFDQAWGRTEKAFKATIGNMLGSLFQLKDAVEDFFENESGPGAWGRSAARALIDQTPLALLYTDSSRAPGSFRRTVMGQGRTDAMSGLAPPDRPATFLSQRSDVWRPPSVEDLLRIYIPAPVDPRVVSARQQRLDALTGRDVINAAQQTWQDIFGRGGVGVGGLSDEAALRVYGQFTDAAKLAPKIAPKMGEVLQAALQQLESNPVVMERATRAVGEKLIRGIFDPYTLRAGVITGVATLEREVSNLLPQMMLNSPQVQQSVRSAGESMIARALDPRSLTMNPRSWSAAGFSGDQATQAIYGSLPRPDPNAGPGFWDSRSGRALGAGIGIAGGAAIGAMAGGDQIASLVGTGASVASAAALGSAGMSAAALGAATMGIGAAAVGVYMLAKHFTTVSKEVKQARVDIAEFQQELWKTATATQMNEAAGRDWAATVIVVRDAYSRMGKSAAEAEADVLAMWDDSHPERAREAMQRITTVMNAFREVLAEANTEMSTLLQQATALGTRLPQGLIDQLQALIDRGDLDASNADLVRRLSSASEVDYDRVRQRADALGLDPNALGAGLTQHETTQSAQQYIDDIDLFRRAGIDMGTILSGMSDELSGLVQQAIKFNAELPANMQPWIQELHRAGLLVDENGEKLEELSGLKWGETLETSTQRLIDSIQELIDTLNGPLQRAFDNIPREVRTRHIIERDELPPPPGRERPEGYQHGGVVYAAQGYVARGTDTVPAMLTPGEGVLSRRGMAMLGALNSGLPGVGGGGVDYGKLAEALVTALRKQPPVVSMSGRVVSQQLVPHLGPALREAGAWR